MKENKVSQRNAFEIFLSHRRDFIFLAVSFILPTKSGQHLSGTVVTKQVYISLHMYKVPGPRTIYALQSATPKKGVMGTTKNTLIKFVMNGL